MQECKKKIHKNQLILSQSMNTSKKRTNQFVFTTVRRVFDYFLEEIEDTKKTFEIIWPLKDAGRFTST